ncbi:sensor histidine kinase ComP [Kordia sp. SMS9]|nr:sensor histidine kinase ComP [Kordia sp. SMS9]
MLFSVFVHAENSEFDVLVSKGDSLKKVKQYQKALDYYKKALSITEKSNNNGTSALIHNKIGAIYYFLKKYETAKIAYKKTLQLHPISYASANAYSALGLVHRKLKNGDSILPNIEKGLQLYERFPYEKETFNSFLNAGIIYKNKQHYDKATQNLLKAASGFEVLKDYKKLAATKNAIAEIQRELGNIEKARDYYTEALQLRKQLKDTASIAKSFNNLGNFHKEINDFDSAINYYKKALKLKKRTSKSYGITLHNIGISYYKKGNVTLAKKTYLEALENKKRFKDSLSIGYTHNELLAIALDENRLPIAKKYIAATQSIFNTGNDKVFQLRNLKLQTLYHVKLQQYKKAYEKQLIYQDIYTNLYDEEQAERIFNAQEKYETEQKQNDILKLSLKTVKQENTILNQTKKIKEKNLYILIFLILFLAFIGTYFFLRLRQKAQKKEVALQNLKAIFDGQEVIRKQIGKDIHDIIASGFDGLRLKVLSLGMYDVKTKKIANHISEEIIELNQQVRLISHRLSPLDDKIKKYKLTEIIRARLSEFQLFGNIHVTLKTPFSQELNQISLDDQTNFYGIFLELLNNISKHSQATEVCIENKIINPKTYLLQVQDNGIGIQEKSVEGIGILNMKQRIKLLQGTISFQSTEKGLTTEIQFPLNYTQNML